MRKSQYRYNNSQRVGIFILAGIIAGLGFSGSFLIKAGKQSDVPVFPQELAGFHNEFEDKGLILQPFDPNELTEEQWRDLGFSEKNVSTIIKYKYTLGGNFSNKDQIRECWAISDKKYRELEPFIVFGDLEKYEGKSGFQKKIQYHKFNPNNYSQSDWMKFGFTEGQARSILKYKNSLGGKFTSKNQLKDCFVIDENKFREMEPYIVIPVENNPQRKARYGSIALLEADENQPDESPADTEVPAEESQPEISGTITLLSEE